MQQLIERIRERLKQSAYMNEAAISHGVVMPIVGSLGWDTADPAQVVPEFPIEGRGRIDFALFGIGRKPSVLIEVKGVGRAVEADRQLFEYAFHQGVPLCVLTDGREWSFYLPSGQGSYEDRRVYRLQLDDREPEECERVLHRYLARERVRDQSAFEDAQRDYRDAAGKREAAGALHRAWTELLGEVEGLVPQAVADKAEALCGFRPGDDDVRRFLRTLQPQVGAKSAPLSSPRPVTAGGENTLAAGPASKRGKSSGPIQFKIFGEQRETPTAALALVEILRALVTLDPDKVSELSVALRKRTRSIVDRSPQLINPNRPDLAEAVDIGNGWMVGLNLSNQDKMRVIRTAAQIYGLRMPEDLRISLPNAN